MNSQSSSTGKVDQQKEENMLWEFCTYPCVDGEKKCCQQFERSGQVCAQSPGVISPNAFPLQRDIVHADFKTACCCEPQRRVNIVTKPDSKSVKKPRILCTPGIRFLRIALQFEANTSSPEGNPVHPSATENKSEPVVLNEEGLVPDRKSALLTIIAIIFHQTRESG